MARPTNRVKSSVSLALTDLRTFLKDSQQEFSERVGTTAVSVARWETSHPPGGKTLERLLKLARKHHHAASAKVFENALANADVIRRARKRRDQILDPLNMHSAAERLTDAWHAHQKLRLQVMSALDGPDQHVLIALDEADEALLQTADLICFEGRKELTGESK